MSYFMIGFWVLVCVLFLAGVGYTYIKFLEEAKRNGY
jgi:hypothetical protein